MNDELSLYSQSTAPPRPPPTVNHRACEALAMRRSGAKLDTIADHFGVSRERARQLTVLGLEIERRLTSRDPWDELSVRCRHCLVDDGCEPTPDGVHNRYRRTSDLKHIPYFGPKCIAELQSWLTRHGKEPLPC